MNEKQENVIKAIERAQSKYDELRVKFKAKNILPDEMLEMDVLQATILRCEKLLSDVSTNYTEKLFSKFALYVQKESPNLFRLSRNIDVPHDTLKRFSTGDAGMKYEYGMRLRAFLMNEEKKIK